MVGSLKAPPPIVALAAGAASAFYSLSRTNSSVTSLVAGLSSFSPLVIILGSLALVIGVSPPALLGLPEHLRRTLAPSLAAFAIGLSIGAACSAQAKPRIAWGLPPELVGLVEVKLRNDPAPTKSATYYAEVDLLAAETTTGQVAGRRSSARGRLRVYLPAGLVVSRGDRCRLAGRYIESSLPSFQAVSGNISQPASSTEQIRTSFRRALISRFEPYEWGGLAAALLLAHKADLADGENELWSRAGCAHVLSLSGMHLAVIAALVSLLLNKALGLKPALISALGLCFAYVQLAGVQAALIRSILMYALHAWAKLRGRRSRLLCVLAAAFLIQLLMAPSEALGLAMILSYTALLGIGLIGRALDYCLDGLIPAAIRTALAASVGAFLATAAIQAAFFGELRPIGLIVGIPVALLAEIIMVAAMVWLISSFVLPFLVSPLAWLIGLVYQVCSAVVKAAATAPSLVATPQATAALSLAAGALLLYLQYRLYERRRRINQFDQL